MRSRRTVGFIEPCLPFPAKRPPAGPNWIYEIKHDGFCIMARRDCTGVRLITRNGNDFTARFPLAAAVAALPGRSFPIDGEAIVTDDSGLAVFDLIRRKRHGGNAVLIAFDLIELDGEDLRRSRLSTILFEHACKLGCEGIVSKRLGSHYRSGRADCWIKVKNPAAPAVKREAEEDWGR